MPCAETKAFSILSLRCIESKEDDQSLSQSIPPCLFVRSGTIANRSKNKNSRLPSASTQVSTTSLEILIPSLSADIYKPELDGLQLWADDLAQWAERALGDKLPSTATSSREPSMIGSRYFVQRTASVVGSEASANAEPKRSEFVVKTVINDGMLTINGFVKAIP